MKINKLIHKKQHTLTRTRKHIQCEKHTYFKIKIYKCLYSYKIKSNEIFETETKA